MSKASPPAHHGGERNDTDDPNGVNTLLGSSGYKGISIPDATALVITLQQVIIDEYSRHFVKSIPPQEARELLIRHLWGDWV
jgi:hypothetical protein